MQQNQFSRYSKEIDRESKLNRHNKRNSYQTINSNTQKLPEITKVQRFKTLSAYEYQLQKSLKKQINLNNLKKEIQRKAKLRSYKKQQQKDIKIISEVHQLKQKLKSLSHQKQLNISQKISQMQNYSLVSSPSYQSYQYHPQSPFQYRNSNAYSNPMIPMHLRSSYYQSNNPNQTLNNRNSNQQHQFVRHKSKKKEKKKKYLTLDLDQEQKKKIYQQQKIPKKNFQKSQYKKRLRDFQRNNTQRKQHIRKRIRKCFLAVYFLKILQKTCLKIINQRRNFFLQYWPKEFFKTQQSFKKFYFSKFQPFFLFLHTKKQSSFIIQGGETKALKREKLNMINQTLKLFFQSLYCLKNNQKVGQIAWAFCKHGSFIDKGVLTVQQMDLVCISEKFGYLRMDKNLEKSQIINLLIFKLIIFKYMLHPQSFWLEAFNPSQNQILTQNILFLASLIYEIFIGVQEMYLQKVDKQKFKIGNWKFMKNRLKQLSISVSPSLFYQTEQSNGQIINGLLRREYISKIISVKKKVQTFKNACIQIIDDIHKKSCLYQNEFNKKVANKKVKIQLKY